MSNSTTIRRVAQAPVADFDDYGWPINALLLILASCVAGTIVARADFDASQPLRNGWVQLGIVAATVTVLIVTATLLRGRVQRRMQLAILISLLVHLALSWSMQRYFLPAVRPLDDTAWQTEVYEPVLLPEYPTLDVHEQPVAEPLERPVDTELPTPEPVAVPEPKPAEPKIKIASRARPEPIEKPIEPKAIEIERAETSAPKFSERLAEPKRSQQEKIDAPVTKPALPQLTAEATSNPVAPAAIERLTRATTLPELRPQAIATPAAAPSAAPAALPRAATIAAPPIAAPSTAAVERSAAAVPSDFGSIAERAAVQASSASSAPQPANLAPTAAPSSVALSDLRAAPSAAAAAADMSRPQSTAAQRATASQSLPRGSDTGPSLPAKIAQSVAGADIPTSALPATAGPRPEAGASREPSPANLSSSAATARRASDAPLSRSTADAGTGIVDTGPQVTSATVGRASGSDTTAVVPGPLGSSSLARNTGPATTVDVPRIAAAAPAGPAAAAGGTATGSSAANNPLAGTVARARPETAVAVSSPSSGSGAVPVRIAEPAGPGGMGGPPGIDLGLPSRLARSESDAIHTAPSRMILERSGGAPAIDARVRDTAVEGLKQRDRASRGQIAESRGGTAGTERAVELGLDFLARHQSRDGSWSLHQWQAGRSYDDPAPASMQSSTAATGLALLAFLGAGYTHTDGKYQSVVAGGLDDLTGHQKPDGDLFVPQDEQSNVNVWLYSHGIASIALCEAYGMTRDVRLREPAQRALEFIVYAQHPTEGGWRYSPQQGSDTSVSGWQVMALKSGELAGLSVPSETYAKVIRWLDAAQGAGGNPARYAYRPNSRFTNQREPSRVMTAEALLMRQYLGWRRDNENMIAGADWLRGDLPQFGTVTRETPAGLRDAYYWYYATQVMFQMQGNYWEQWNQHLRALLVDSQEQSGGLAGSWHPLRPVPDRWGSEGGRLYVTALHLLMLEVYYRHLPIYQTLD
ncbi:MAG TPA: hypothetical protein VHZ24_11910 [Pirellulales bacterium]|nr:hypothetical protein [Pirellulales bacterium]